MALRPNGEAIRALRVAMGRRSGEFAVAVGTKHPHLSNIEAGRANASPALLKRIADELGVTMGAVTIPVPEPHREEVPA